MAGLPESAQGFQDRLNALGFSNIAVELPDSARTAQAAADALGCEPAHIAKSIIFRLTAADKPLLVVASGVNRVNEMQIGSLLNDVLEKADADFVRGRTGYAIGGVPPVCHAEPILTLVDEDLFQYKTIWAAAGHPKTVFQLTPDELVQMTGGQVVCVK